MNFNTVGPGRTAMGKIRAWGVRFYPIPLTSSLVTVGISIEEGTMEHPNGAIAGIFDHNQNKLWQYMQSLGGETATQLFQPSPEASQLIESQIIGMLGGLPAGHFDVEITTNREQLGRLLASAMMSGYFLHRAEQRMALEQQFKSTYPEA